MLANYGFAAIFATPKLAGLQQVARIEAEGQSYGSPKNGRSEANHLANAGDVVAKLPHAQTALREGHHCWQQQ